jgi:hypothetical protein
MSANLPGESPETATYQVRTGPEERRAGPTGPTGPAGGAGGAARQEPIALVDLLDRVLAGGVVIVGDVRLSIADVDLVTISLQALISSVSTVMEQSGDRAS